MLIFGRERCAREPWVCVYAGVCVCVSQQTVFGGWRHSASSTCPLENPSSDVCAPPMCLYAGMPSGIFPLSHSWPWSVSFSNPKYYTCTKQVFFFSYVSAKIFLHPQKNFFHISTSTDIVWQTETSIVHNCEEEGNWFLHIFFLYRRNPAYICILPLLSNRWPRSGN